MLIAKRVPNPPLSEFVELLWFFRGPSRAHAKERLLPQGSAELVINLDEDLIRIYDRDNLSSYRTLSGSVICGPHSQFFVIDTSEQQSVLGVHFKPGGLFPFIGAPAAELHNLHVSLDDIWGRRARTLRDRLVEAPTPATKFEILQQALLAALSPAFKQRTKLERHPAVAYALRELDRADNQPTVAGVTEKIGLSVRRFSQLFGEEVGLTPKLYSRVQRFQQVLRQIEPSGAEFEWTEIALAAGYYDQAHFNHDFREFSGINPRTYALHRTGHLNHVPLAD